MEFETKPHINPIPTQRGLNTNPGFILDSTEIIGNDGYLIHTNNNNTLEYLNGIAIQVNGSQKQIINTDWYPSGVFIDNMTLTVNYTTKNNDSLELPENSRIITGKIFKRHPQTYKILSSTDINFLHQKELSNTLGVQPKNVQNNLLSNAILYFDPQYEYRLELYSESQLSPNQTITLDYIQLNYIDNLSYSNSYHNNISKDTIQIIEANDNLTINIGNDGYGEATLTTTTLDQPTTNNTLYNLFTTIQSININLKDPDNWYAQKKMPIYSITTQWTNNNTNTGKNIIIHVICNKTNNPHTLNGNYTIIGLSKNINI